MIVSVLPFVLEIISYSKSNSFLKKPKYFISTSALLESEHSDKVAVKSNVKKVELMLLKLASVHSSLQIAVSKCGELSLNFSSIKFPAAFVKSGLFSR